MTMYFKNLFFFAFLSLAFVVNGSSDITVYFNQNCPKSQFAVREITSGYNIGKIIDQPLEALKGKRGNVSSIVLYTINNTHVLKLMENSGAIPEGDMKEEGFCIRRTGNKNPVIWVLGKDDAGLMYGALEVAEIIGTQGLEAIGNDFQNPYMDVRGTKFNIPLDVRTPSYSDVSDAAQKNMIEMWNIEFWKEYIDNLAKHRYNLISLWNLHPFPSMVKVPDYPDIALDDVHQSTKNWNEHYHLCALDFDAPEIVDNYKVIKKITIEKKMNFWREVMKYGKERNVRFFVVTWNIFVNGTSGKYGITDKAENPVTTDYFRKSVKQMFLTYPDLAGIGLATGENMLQYTNVEKEDWAFDTYGLGVLDVLKEQPDREITFIHRQHMTGAREASTKFAPVIAHPNIDFVFSFKYAQAHVYSSIDQVFHHNFVRDIKQADLKTLWTLRNDDVYFFRWGAPDFVRDFIKGIPHDVSRGYYYGSDQYIWGREFLSRLPEAPRQLEISKHWYQWMLWGRLGYNPDWSNQGIVNILQAKYPDVDARSMFDAWQSASMIYPLTTGFHWGALDFQWYIESGQSRPFPAQNPSGYHDVNRFISLPPHRGTGFISIPDYVNSITSGESKEGATPLEVAQKIQEHAENAFLWSKGVKAFTDKEFRQAFDDITSMAYLGKYYAHKIRGATFLALFRETLDRDYFNDAMDELNHSALYWRYYTSVSLANYHNPLWTNRVGNVDWRNNYNHVLYDITSNGGIINVPSMAPSSGGTILEAEEAKSDISVVRSIIPGFTGNGYLETTRSGDAIQQVEWSYSAPEAGYYILEFRYTLKREQPFISPVLINGKQTGDIVFYMTGKPGSWAWERVIVYLEKGENTIQVSPEGFVLLDHLNVLNYIKPARK